MTEYKDLQIGNLTVGTKKPLTIIAGPCVIEGEKEALTAAEKLRKIADDLGIGIIYKSSYDKANRSSLTSFRGIGIKRGLGILRKVKEKFDMPVLSDVHNEMEIPAASEVLDVIQIPAFLSRQTDILVSAAKTGRVVNVKKGQFMAPQDMKKVIEKLEQSGNANIMLTERGTSFGYHNLVSDMRSLPIMGKFGYPVVFDATHSVQLPGAKGDSSGGDRQFVAPLARAAVAVGVAAVFMEVHVDPDNAPCDGPNMLRIKDLSRLLQDLADLDAIAKRPKKKKKKSKKTA